jgi:DNA-binding NarL/FixJ family response regulator
MISILVARTDRSTLSEQELAGLANEDGFSILVVIGDLPQVSHAVATIQPDILLLDGRFVRQSTLPALVALCKNNPGCKVLVICRNGNEFFAGRCLQFGARGICKPIADSNALARAIRGVHAGDWWYSRRLLGERLETLLSGMALKQHLALHSQITDAGITDRERAIIHYAALGMTNKEIARELGISDKTVKAHLSHIFRKLHICHRIDLARLETQ